MESVSSSAQARPGSNVREEQEESFCLFCGQEEQQGWETSQGELAQDSKWNAG